MIRYLALAILLAALGVAVDVKAGRPVVWQEDSVDTP